MKKHSDEDTTEKIEIAHTIQNMFRYNYKNQWVTQKILHGRSRLWQKTFNELVEMGLIEKKKDFLGYQYRWKAAYPEVY